MYRLHRETFIPASIEAVFDFFSRADNLNHITPPWLHFKILTRENIRMAEATVIDYSIRLHGIPIKWKTRIIEWNPPHQFVDLQIQGPYTYWRHTHQFEKRTDSVTMMHDTVDYIVPGKIFAPLIHGLLVKRDLERIFYYREKMFTEIFSRKK